MSIKIRWVGLEFHDLPWFLLRYLLFNTGLVDGWGKIKIKGEHT